jgi:hypothetical protein
MKRLIGGGGSGGGSGTPGGSDTEIQFNDGGAFAGSADLTWDDTGKVLEIGGDINLDDGGTYETTMQVVTPTANRTISFPDATGTVALVAGSSGQLLYNASGANAGTSTITYDGTNVTLSGRFISSLNGAASAPPGTFTGTWFTGGTSTTTKPHFLCEPTGTTSTAWSTSGTGIGVNAASGFAGRLIDLQLNGTSNFSVDSTGRASVPLGTAALPSIYPGTDTNTGIYSPGSDQVAISTNGTGRLFVDASGGVSLAGSVLSGTSAFRISTASAPGSISLGTQGGAISAGRETGKIEFGFNAASEAYGAAISSINDSGTNWGANSPGALIFKTTTTGNTPVERMRITSGGNISVTDAGNIAVGTTTGTKIGTAAAQKLGFFGVTPVVQQTELTDELTTITHTAPGTADFAIQNLSLTGYGFVTEDEGNTVLSVIANLQARVNELETKLVALGFLADAD